MLSKITRIWRKIEDVGMPFTDVISILAIIISLLAILLPYLRHR